MIDLLINLPWIQNIVEIHLEKNEIKDNLVVFTDFLHLKTLNLTENLITDWKEVHELAGCERLQNLYFKKNPIYKFINKVEYHTYRNEIF